MLTILRYFIRGLTILLTAVTLIGFYIVIPIISWLYGNTPYLGIAVVYGFTAFLAFLAGIPWAWGLGDTNEQA